MAIGTTNISLGNIYGEVNNTLPGGTNVSLKTQSESASNTGHTSTISGYTSPGGGITGAPYGMGEFGGYVNALQTAANVQDGVASFADVVIQSQSNFVISFGRWQLVNQSQYWGQSNYRHQWYIEERDSGFPGSYTPTIGSNTAMSTGTLYAWHHVDFTTSNWPDSYYVDVSTSKAQIGAAQSTFTDIAGVGETYTSDASWDGSVKTLLSPTNSGRTAYGFQHSASTECNDFDINWTVNVKIYYRKSGYPDLLAVDRDVAVSQEGYWAGSICE